VRIEDTILITETGNVVLSAHVPKEVDEILALVGRRARQQ
jgi:Xaa-Pro aminopeptidase